MDFPTAAGLSAVVIAIVTYPIVNVMEKHRAKLSKPGNEGGKRERKRKAKTTKAAYAPISRT